MIHVLAEIRLADGARDPYLAELRRLEPLVRAEEGCIEYVGTIDTRTSIQGQAPLREDVVILIEKWESESALALHLNARHMVEYRRRVRDLVASTTIHVLTSV